MKNNGGVGDHTPQNTWTKYTDDQAGCAGRNTQTKMLSESSWKILDRKAMEDLLSLVRRLNEEKLRSTCCLAYVIKVAHMMAKDLDNSTKQQKQAD